MNDIEALDMQEALWQKLRKQKDLAIRIEIRKQINDKAASVAAYYSAIRGIDEAMVGIQDKTHPVVRRYQETRGRDVQTWLGEMIDPVQLAKDQEKLLAKSVEQYEKLEDIALFFVMLALLATMDRDDPQWSEKAAKYFEAALKSDNSPIALVLYNAYGHEQGMGEITAEMQLKLLGALLALVSEYVDSENDERVELSDEEAEVEEVAWGLVLRYLEDASVVFHQLASAAFDEGDVQQMEQYLQANIDLYWQLHEKKTTRSFMLQIAEQCSLTGDIYVKVQHYKQAEEMYEEAREAYFEAGEVDEDDEAFYEQDVVCVDLKIAQLYVAMDRGQEAVELLEELTDELVAMDMVCLREQDIRNVLEGLRYLAHNALAQGKYYAGIQYYEKILSHCRVLARDSNVEDIDLLAQMLAEVGGQHANAKQIRPAIQAYVEALENYRALVKVGDGEYRPRLVEVLAQLAALYYQRKPAAKGRECMDEAIAVWRTMQHLPEAGAVQAVIHQALHAAGEDAAEYMGRMLGGGE